MSAHPGPGVTGKIPQKGDAPRARLAKINRVSGRRGEISPSAARALSDPEREALIDLAKSLPDTWAVQLEPPHGQVAIVPLACRRRFHGCWIAAARYRRLVRDNGLTY